MCAKRYDDENPSGFDPDELDIFNEEDEFEDDGPTEEEAPKEKKPAPKKKSSSGPKRKKSRRRKPQAADDSEVVEESDTQAEEQATPEPEPEPEPEPVEPDHPDLVAALKDLGARLEVNEAGNVWRVFFYEKNNDEHLAQIRDLHSLKEVWLLGTKVTEEGAKELKERLPDVTVNYK